MAQVPRQHSQENFSQNEPGPPPHHPPPMGHPPPPPMVMAPPVVAVVPPPPLPLGHPCPACGSMHFIPEINVVLLVVLLIFALWCYIPLAFYGQCRMCGFRKVCYCG